MIYPYTPPDFEPLAKAILLMGGKNRFLRKLGISRQAFRQWRGVPLHQCEPIERHTGGEVTKWMLRPDAFAAEAPYEQTIVVRASPPPEDGLER